VFKPVIHTIHKRNIYLKLHYLLGGKKMKIKTIFAGVFAALLALAILPGAFAQQTGASPEVGVEEETKEVTRRAVLSDMYGYCAYGVFPRVGPCIKGVLLVPFVTIGGGLLADILGLLQSLLGMDFQPAIDEMTGASPHMMPFFAGIFSALGFDIMEYVESCASMLDSICSLPFVNSCCWWGFAETLMRHMFGPTLTKELMPQSYGLEG